MSEQKIKAGDLYKKITVAGREFEIRYMDMGEIDPEAKGECIPDFPFFDEQPEYTDDRYPFTNALNDSCEHYKTDDATPDNTCRDCIYFKDVVEELGVCRCTARRLRGVGKPITGKLMKVAVIGNLPTAEKVIKDSYLNVQFDNYYRATDMAGLPEAYDLIIVESYAGEGLGLMELTVKYKANTHEEVTVPVKLLAEPTTCAVEDELSVFVKLFVARKLNGENTKE